jgi:replication factor C small subunit
MSSLINKYIPKQINEMIGQLEIRKSIAKYLEENNLDNIPHLLFSGKAGLGKTTLANVIALYFYRENLKQGFFEFNASDDRGIDFIRTTIKTVVSQRAIGNKRKIILLDEMDSLTKEAQESLKRIMEQYAKNVLFIFTCNNISKVVDPILSRCNVYEFSPIKDVSLEKYLIKICENEKINYTLDDIKYIMLVSNGDVRKSINNLEKLKTGQIIEVLPDSLLRLSANEFLRITTRHNFETVREILLNEILANENLLAKGIKILAEMDYRIAVGSNKDLQLFNCFLTLKENL